MNHCRPGWHAGVCRFVSTVAIWSTRPAWLGYGDGNGYRISQSVHIFMLSLAIVDDIGAIFVVAFGYSSHIVWGALAVAVVGLAVVRIMAMLGIRSSPLYRQSGCIIWVAMDTSGIHPTITGVILGLMTPVRRWVSDKRLYAILNQVVAHPSGNQGSGNTKGSADIAGRRNRRTGNIVTG